MELRHNMLRSLELTVAEVIEDSSQAEKDECVTVISPARPVGALSHGESVTCAWDASLAVYLSSITFYWPPNVLEDSPLCTKPYFIMDTTTESSYLFQMQ